MNGQEQQHFYGRDIFHRNIFIWYDLVVSFMVLAYGSKMTKRLS